MITLNTEKGLVRIESWEDVIGRPGFVIDLDPSTIELKTIIGSYNFKDYVKCGLSSCHQPHGRGYLVTTTDGLETNIGKDCGKKHFSVDFEQMRNAYDRDFRNKERREQLEKLLGRTPAYLEMISEIRKGPMGADSLYKDIQALTTRGRGVPDEIVKRLLQMGRARNSRIAIQREATVLEIENLEAIQGKKVERPYYLDKEIGHLAGIAALYPEHNLRNILIFDVLDGLDHLQRLHVSTLSDADLLKLSKWASELDAKLSTARRAMREAKMLLAPPNIIKLDVWVEGKDEKRMFSKFIAKLATRLDDGNSLAA